MKEGKSVGQGESLREGKVLWKGDTVHQTFSNIILFFFTSRFWQNTLNIDDLNTLKITEITEGEEGSSGSGSYETREVTEEVITSQQAVTAHAAPQLAEASSYEEGRGIIYLFLWDCYNFFYERLPKLESW